ncbi:MAG: beta-lactamase family protein [Ignavibacterium sp.]|nr:MAG: beta-lactamase family protein [Ignavibacterium sp.]
MRLLFLSVIFFLAIVSCCKPQTNNYDFNEVDKIINSAIENKAFPGAVVLVSKDGEIIYEKSVGHLTYDENSPLVSNSTIYDIASLTKVVVTTTSAMICYDRQLFSLDDQVAMYLPLFAKNGKENVTIKNLLLHNSGLPAFKRYYDKYNSADEVIDVLYSIELDYKTGIKTVYSDLGMIILGKLIETVTGKKLDQFCDEEIFQPLLMNNTYYNPPDSFKYKIAPTEYDDYWRKRLVWGSVHDENSALMGGVAGHAGLFSTANDLSHLVQMLLNGGSYNGRQLIKPKTVHLFTKRYSAQSTRALGWDTKSAKGSSAGELFDIKSFGHTGFTGTSIWVDPIKELFVIFLTNRVHPTRDNKKLFKIRPALHNAIMKSID